MLSGRQDSRWRIPRRLAGVIGLAAGLLAGCIMPQGEATHSPTAAPQTEQPSPPPTDAPALLDIESPDWQSLAPGLESRVLVPDAQRPFTRMVALRIDPAFFTFRAHYTPGVALTTRHWTEALPDATVIINANFFSPDDEILGMLVADGVLYGRTFTDRGGMFAVRDGGVRVQSLVAEPYGGEFLEQAVQAFPMLVVSGAASYAGTPTDRLTRRTIIGQSTDGRIIILATPLLGLTLGELSTYLPTTDLGLVNAVNLDGGGSTQMVVQVPGVLDYTITSFDAVPAVLAVYPR
ncbi:MAG: phosphodiester glycosidase family protein [Anaerolineaceae bacterium]|nr:phosphodiester glycosidase family protein [Anaerolineaceae bacterium]